MPQPIEFEIQEYRFRHTPLCAIPLAQEYEKLLTRFDQDSGALNALAFTFDDADFEAIASQGLAGMAKLVKILSMLVTPGKTAIAEDADEDDPQPVDTLPRSLPDLCLHYARIGKVEHCVKSGDTEQWIALQTEDAFNKHPQPISIMVCTVRVIGGLFAPLGDLLRALSDKAAALLATKSTAPKSGPEPTASTSEN